MTDIGRGTAKTPPPRIGEPTDLQPDGMPLDMDLDDGPIVSQIEPVESRPQPRPALPNPGITEIGRPCNTPLRDHEDRVVGYCEVILQDVYRDPIRAWWPKRIKPQWVDHAGNTVCHKGDHRITWR